jgi:hypothetical protein
MFDLTLLEEYIKAVRDERLTAIQVNIMIARLQSPQTARGIDGLVC